MEGYNRGRAPRFVRKIRRCCVSRAAHWVDSFIICAKLPRRAARLSTGYLLRGAKNTVAKGIKVPCEL